jgi:hypothetical protein
MTADGRAVRARTAFVGALDIVELVAGCSSSGC